MNIYCGNNANHPDLLNGNKILGSRYTCLQKGKRNGYSQPIDPNFLLPYRPIDETRKYCGTYDNLPNGYDRFGGLYECYLKGMGVGKKLKAQNIHNSPIQQQVPHNSPIIASLSPIQQQVPHNSPFSPIQQQVPYNSPLSPIQQQVPHNSSFSPIQRQVPNNSPVQESTFYKNLYKEYTVGFLLGFSVFFIGMYYGKPNIIMDKTNPNEEKIDWSKFIPYLVSFAVVYGVLVYFFIKYLFK